MNTLTRLAAWILFAVAATSVAQAQTQAYQIAATIKTVSKNKSDRQDLPKGSTRLIEEGKVLSMQFRRTNPTVGESAEVKWLVLMEDMKGRTRPATIGSQQISTQVGIPMELNSAEFSLSEREWSGRKEGSGSIKQKIKGYGILVVDAKGSEIASKFSPASVEEALRAEMAEQAKREEAPVRPKTPPRRLRF